MLITLLLFGAFVLLMFFSAFFSSAETVFFALGPLELRRIGEKHPTRIRILRELVSQPTRILSTVLVGNTIVNVAIAAIGYGLAERLWPGHGEQVSIPVVTVLLVIFGEAGPKRFGLLAAEWMATWYALPMRGFTYLLAPVRSFVERVTHSFEPFFRPRGRTLSEEELETILDLSEEQGVINSDELAMIKAIIHLEDLKASDVMTPRVDIIGLDLADPDPERYLQVVREAHRNFVVLYRNHLDYIEGFLDVRKFLLDPAHSVERATLPPFFVPETSPLNRLLTQFQSERRRIAVVADEFGGTAGLITRGDILEEITGDIYHELSKPQAVFQSAGPHRWIVDPSISLEELNRRLLLNLHVEDADRLSGWMAAMLGRVPTNNDTVEAQGCRVTVLQTIRQRVTLVMIEKLGGGA